MSIEDKDLEPNQLAIILTYRPADEESPIDGVASEFRLSEECSDEGVQVLCEELCQMLAASLAVRDDGEMVEMLNPYIQTAAGMLMHGYDSEEDEGPAVTRDGNVYTLDFNTKTEGSA